MSAGPAAAAALAPARARFSLYFRPRVELARFRAVDFFPPPLSREELSRAGTVCVATKSRNLGDALALSTLPRRLSAEFPGLRVDTYVRAFNPVVFYGNPFVTGVRYLPRAVYGDDANFDSGQQIQLKEQYFGLAASRPPRPELYLLESEKAWASMMLARNLFPENAGKPLCVIHPWGSTRSRVASVEHWDRVVERWRGKFRFWQVGVQGHGAVQGCEYYLLSPRSFRSARKLFALMERAAVFVGVDSGPMHVARAFDVPSLVLLDHADPARAFEARRKGEPYFLHSNWQSMMLYEENRHLRLDAGEATAMRQIDAFFEEQASRVR